MSGEHYIHIYSVDQYVKLSLTLCPFGVEVLTMSTGLYNPSQNVKLQVVCGSTPDGAHMLGHLLRSPMQVDCSAVNVG